MRSEDREVSTSYNVERTANNEVLGSNLSSKIKGETSQSMN